MLFLMFIGGLVALVLGADWMVRGASKMATSFGVSPLTIGLTVIAFGTSAPEIAVSVGAVMDGTTDLAVGNVVGSNIFNVLFILGICALITPLTVNRQLIRQEVPIMVAASILLLPLCMDGVVSLADGLLLMALLTAYTVLLVTQSRRQQRAQAARAEPQDTDTPRRWDDSRIAQFALVLVGLGALVLGSEWLVTSSVAFAQAAGVSDAVIGLTIVAAGTSLPEVAASVTAALKGQRDMAVGNVIGSNTFNILGCLGITALAAGESGLTIVESVQSFDVWVMLAVALACVPVFVSGREISRWEGVFFLAYYAAYTAYLILAAQQSDLLMAFTELFTTFVIPLSMLAFVLLTYGGHAAAQKRRV